MTQHHLDVDPRTRRIELVISILLRGGVILSLLVVVAGMIVSFIHHPAYMSSGNALAPLTSLGGPVPKTLSDVWHGALAGSGQSIVEAGLLLLVATPVMRVAVSIVAFLIEKDRKFAVITSVVLFLLLLSFFLGRASG